MTLTEAEVLEALRDALRTADIPDAFTLRELREATGWGEKKAREKMLLGKRAGSIAVVTVERENLQGRMVPVVAYRIVKPPKGRKKAA